MKTLTALIVSVFLLAGCTSAKAVSSDTADGITVELHKITYEKKAIRVAIPDVTITNHTGEPVTAVFWNTVFLDGNGEVIGEKKMFWQGEKEALRDGDSLRVTDGRYVIDFDENPSSVEVTVKEVHLEKDHPLDQIPETGEYLYEALGYEHLAKIKETPPVRIECGVDHSGYLRIAEFEGDAVKEAVDAFVKIKVGAGDAPMVTDNYNYFSFTWADGVTVGVRVNLRYLEVSANGRYYSYELEDDGDFWNLINANLRDADVDAPLTAFGRNSGINMTLDEISFVPSDTPDVLTMEGRLTMENTSKYDLVQVCYELSFLNEDNIVYAHKVYFPEQDQLAKAGSTSEMRIEADLPEGADEPKAVRLDILTVTRETEVADNTALKEGEYLYKALGNDTLANMDQTLPIMMEVHIDRMGFGHDTVFTEEKIPEAAERFMKIKVGRDGAPMVTDNYNHVTLLFEDGSEVTLRLNLYALEYFVDGTAHSYSLDGMKEFLDYAESKRS